MKLCTKLYKEIILIYNTAIKKKNNNVGRCKAISMCMALPPLFGGLYRVGVVGASSDAGELANPQSCLHVRMPPEKLLTARSVCGPFGGCGGERARCTTDWGMPTGK
ncbi:hypothetical protein PV328_011249 [Microctonus aethiopoides]|uniref:Uncharacterized protein n=1 Tax=Microctonus aethiopoides TaxID=144406 RepID=A0AA39C443_9HYME|nr:hypothetical protein PV328_011249 [Microctonus aethiopoides]